MLLTTEIVVHRLLECAQGLAQLIVIVPPPVLVIAWLARLFWETYYLTYCTLGKTYSQKPHIRGFWVE